MGEGWARWGVLEGFSHNRTGILQQDGTAEFLTQFLPRLQGWNTSADPRRRQFEIKKGEMEELKREMSEIERKRAMEHKDIVSEVIENNIIEKV